MFRKVFFVLLVVLFIVAVVFSAQSARANAPRKTLIAALITHESGGNDRAIGDKKLKQKAYGPLQIRQPVCIDVNRANGTHYKAADCLGNRELSIVIFEKYMKLYARKERLGHEPTDIDMARIWNGGPDGWESESTVSYGEAIRALLSE